MTRNVGREFDQCLDYKIREQAAKEAEAQSSIENIMQHIKNQGTIYDFEPCCDDRNEVNTSFIDVYPPVELIRLTHTISKDGITFAELVEQAL
jgi:hypothetical protein